MTARHCFSLFGILAILSLSTGTVHAEELTLRSLGAKGDGKTDDRAAIEAAMAKAAGAAVDGEGATYVVHGTIKTHNDVNLRNANFVQTLEPFDIGSFVPSAKGKGQMTVEPQSAFRRMVGSLPVLHAQGYASYSDDVALTAEQATALMQTIDLNTLEITGKSGRPVSVRIEKIKINRGKHAETGNDNCAGVFMRDVSPVSLTDVEVSGDGKGCGVSVRNSSHVRLERVNIHDMTWAPLIGDNVFEAATAKSIKEDFRWNNFPLYSFRTNTRKFVRMRVREQIAGMLIIHGNDVQIVDCKIERLQGRIGDQLFPFQTDAISVTDVKGLEVRNCQFSKVWEGLDITGGLCDGFLVDHCTATDTLSYGFKLAHPKRNGRFVDCTTLRTGNSAYVMGPEIENIEYLRCKALETGASGYWLNDDEKHMTQIRGFAVHTEKAQQKPLNITFNQCSAINESSPSTLDIGFQCESGIDPAERKIRAISCTVVGGSKDFEGLVVH